MATCGAILLVPSQRVRCTLPHNHDGLHSFELDMGKRSRKASLPYQDDGEADDSDDSDAPKKKVKKAEIGRFVPTGCPPAVEPDRM